MFTPYFVTIVSIGAYHLIMTRLNLTDSAVNFANHSYTPYYYATLAGCAVINHEIGLKSYTNFFNQISVEWSEIINK